MPELIQCPSCNRKLRVPDNLIGRKVKCPSCSSAFTAAVEEELPTAPLIEEEEAPRAPRRKPPPPPPPEEQIEEKASRPRRRPAPSRDEDEDEDEADDNDELPVPRSRRRRLEEEYEEEKEEEEVARPRRSKRADWQKVGTGVTLILVSVCLSIVTAIVYVIGFLMVFGAMFGALAARNAPAGAAGAVGGGLALLVTVGILGLACLVLYVLGEIFCLFAPSKHNAKTLATTTLVLTGAAPILYGLGAVTGPFGIALVFIGMLAGYASFFVFLFFLRAVAKCLRDWSLEGSAKNLIILYAATIVGGIVVVILALVVGFSNLPRPGAAPPVAGAVPGAGTYVVGCLSCVDGIMGLASGIWFIILLVQTRNAIAYHVNR